MVKLEWLHSPKADDSRCGIKVSWDYYKSEAKADEAVIAARNNAKIQMREGYDFGYQSPGNKRLVINTRSRYHGMWEVCQP